MKIGLADALRLEAPGPDTKEWHHFLVHQGDRTALLNFQLGGGVGRLIAMSWMGGWQGDVRTWPAVEVGARAGRIDLRLGDNRVRWDGRCYHVHATLPEREWSATLRLEPRSVPLPSWGLTLAPGCPMSWVQVPRLRATGEVRAGDQLWRFEDAYAYHDHNWGSFGWADDFVWEWGTLGGPHPDDPWALGFVRRMDRARRTVLSTAFYLFRDGRLCRVIRGPGVELDLIGRWGARAFTLPRAGALLLPGEARDVPERATLRVRGDDVALDVALSVRALARLVMPWEAPRDGVTVLHQVLLDGAVRGRVGGETLSWDAPGILELIRSEPWADGGSDHAHAGPLEPAPDAPGPLARLAVEVLATLRADQTDRYHAIAACLDGADVMVGRERFGLRLLPAGPALVPAGHLLPALSLAPSTLRALLDDERSVSDAVRAGLLELRGAPATLPRLEEAIARFVAACMAAPSAGAWRAAINLALEQP
jgi:hypothetical protein